MKNAMTAGVLLAALIASGCAGPDRRKAPVQAQAQMPYSKEEVAAWQSAFNSFLQKYGEADSNEALVKAAPEARSLVSLSPAPRARELSLQAYCVTAVGAGEADVWAMGCFDHGGPLVAALPVSGRACGDPGLERTLRAAIEIGGAFETQNLNQTLKNLFRCHQEQGTVGELTKAGSFAKGRYGLPLSMLAWSRGLTLSLPTTDVVDRAAYMMAVSLERTTARR